jgi:hypothetical protein
MLNHLILSLFLFASAPGLFAKITFSQELNEKAQIYLGIKILGGPWSDYGNYFEDLKWLSNFKFQYIQTQEYGNGKGPKDESSDTKELHFVATKSMRSTPGRR